MTCSSSKSDFSIEEICQLLEQTPSKLFEQAYDVKKRNVGTNVFLRGLIEISNICSRDCFYCGIRKSNPDFTRFKMTKQEILRDALWIHKTGYGSLVLQGGELRDPGFTDFINCCFNNDLIIFLYNHFS